jgi:solute carrier family 25 protein 16
MIPYAGVSFLTYGTLKRHSSNCTAKEISLGLPLAEVGHKLVDMPLQRPIRQEGPFEVIRRRMQVGGVGGGAGISWRDAVKTIYGQRGWKGFFVGLSIGYVKVIPMTR